MLVGTMLPIISNSALVAEGLHDVVRERARRLRPGRARPRLQPTCRSPRCRACPSPRSTRACTSSFSMPAKFDAFRGGRTGDESDDLVGAADVERDPRDVPGAGAEECSPRARSSPAGAASTSTPIPFHAADGELGGGRAARAERVGVEEGEAELLAVLLADAVGTRRPNRPRRARPWRRRRRSQARCPRRRRTAQPVGGMTASAVAGPPWPLVSTFCSSARSSAWVRAMRTAGSDVGVRRCG